MQEADNTEGDAQQAHTLRWGGFHNHQAKHTQAARPYSIVCRTPRPPAAAAAAATGEATHLAAAAMLQLV